MNQPEDEQRVLDYLYDLYIELYLPVDSPVLKSALYQKIQTLPPKAFALLVLIANLEEEN